MKLAYLLMLAGGLHFGLLLAGALLPRVLNWRTELRSVSPLSRHIIWVHGAFVVMMIVGFGVLSLLNAPALAAGSLLARSLCAFVALFWFTRLMIQLFLFDARPYLTNWFLTAGYHGLTVLFGYFSIVYGWAAILPRR